MSFFWSSPLGIAVGVIVLVFVAAVIFAGVNVILAISGGPGPCMAGDPPLTVNDTNAASFQEKWDALEAELAAGNPASATFSESEVTSRADQFIRRETDADVESVRICMHEGFAETTGTISALGLDVDVRVQGTLDLTGETPKARIDDIDFGNVPGFVSEIVEGLVNDVVDDALEDIEVEYPVTATLSEGQVLIEGPP